MAIKNPKIIIITNIPAPYRIPLFNELNAQLKSHGASLKVIFAAMGYPRRKWDVDMAECSFNYEVLDSNKIQYRDREKCSFTYSGLLGRISDEKPDVIITNAFSLATLKLWWRSLFKNTMFIIWSGAVHHNSQPDSYLRTLQRKMLVRRASGFIAYGSKAKEYLISLGAEDEKIEIGINTVDTDYFRKETESIRSQAEVTNKTKHLLCIAQLSKRKRIDLLLPILKALVEKRRDILLEIVGSGEDMDNLKSLARKLRVEQFVRFEGFKQKQDIPNYLAKADCFLFPTSFDIWGLVLVEAMAAGVPCIASVHTGATYDLIQEGTTGFSIDFSETGKVAERINWILDNPESAKKIRENAKNIVEEKASIQKSAEGFIRAVEHAFSLNRNTGK
jgi:glycosyltransferase involved in cell wall biosynthesis